jgi:UDP-glucose 4-epimerase
MKILVTGGAGFIGSHLVEFLVARGHRVTVLDDLSTGKREHLAACAGEIRFVQGDIKDAAVVDEVVRDQELVFHLCDNSDIRFAAQHPRTYLDQNVLGCFHVLESMRKHGVRQIVFPSSTTVLGDATVVPTPESYGPLHPMNLYGGAKLACEALISSYAYSFDLRAFIFRFVDIVGGRIDHGVIFDFIRKLRANPAELEILGDGSQRRSFLLVDECVEAMWLAIERCDKTVNTIHMGNRDQISITHVGELVRAEMGLDGARLRYTGGKKGWKGDAFTNFLANDTLGALGWAPRRDSAETVREAAARLIAETATVRDAARAIGG